MTFPYAAILSMPSALLPVPTATAVPTSNATPATTTTMTTTTPPVPATAALVPASAVTQKTHQLHRFLLEVIAYSYKAPIEALRLALLNTLLAGDETAKSVGNATSILDDTERNKLTFLANTIRQARERAHAHQESLITNDESGLLYADVVLPAKQLDVDPAYVFHLLGIYSDHEHDPAKRRLSAPYIHRTRSTLWFHSWSQEGLAAELTSVDLFLEKTSPNPEVRRILGTAVTKFGKKYWKKRKNQPIVQLMKADASSKALVDLLEERTRVKMIEAADERARLALAEVADERARIALIEAADADTRTALLRAADQRTRIALMQATDARTKSALLETADESTKTALLEATKQRTTAAMISATTERSAILAAAAEGRRTSLFKGPTKISDGEWVGKM
jgi:hypothetical protein